MNKFKGLAAAVAVVALAVPSAFAESRHSHETHGSDSSRSFNRHDRGDSNRGSNSTRSETRTFERERSTNRTFDNNNNRTFERGRIDSNNNNFRNNDTFRNDSRRNESTYRNNDRRSNDRGYRNDSSYRNDSYRNNDRRYDNRRNDNRRYDNRGSRGGSFDRGRAFFHEGRVSRYERYGGGFRVWLIGAPYPFFIPEARFRLFPHFGVGVSIRLGGYYNPLGYYDYYDGPYDGYDGGYASGYVGGDLRGIVESVDYRRGTALIQDRASDRFVTVVMRGNDPRFGDLRIGDYVELSGDWTRIGTFEAYGVYNHDEAGYRYR